MNTKGIKAVLGLCYLGFYLYFIYKVLVHIEATEIIWFLFVLTVMMSIVITILNEMVK